MQEADVYAQLTEIFHEIFMRDDLVLSPAMTAKDVPGWDSFKQIEIIISLESHYGITFHTRDLDSLQSVGDLARVVLAKVTTAQPAS